MKMPSIKDVIGKRYPEEAFMRFFFKTGLHKDPGVMLEVGCGFAPNIVMCAQYGWRCYGLEAQPMVAASARQNIGMYELTDECSILTGDMRFLDSYSEISGLKASMVAIPFSLYYMSRSDANKTLKALRDMDLIGPNASVFLGMRGMKDYRYARGKDRIDKSTWIMDTPETGEEGLVCSFYHEYELVDMLRAIDVETEQAMHIEFENVLNGERMMNHDIVIWGRSKT